MGGICSVFWCLGCPVPLGFLLRWVVQAFFLLGDHVDPKARHPAAITRFTAISGRELEEVAIEGSANPSVTGRRTGITVQVTGPSVPQYCPLCPPIRRPSDACLSTSDYHHIWMLSPGVTSDQQWKVMAVVFPFSSGVTMPISLPWILWTVQQ